MSKDTMFPMARIVIFTNNDYTWSFPAWKHLIPELQKQYDVAGVYVFPDRLGKLQGKKIPLWYLRAFGVRNCVILGLYSFLVRFVHVCSRVRTWKGLARAYGIKFHTAHTPNAESVCEWVKARNIDVIFITVGHVLQKEIIEAPRIGIINKHAAILPSCRGLFPFFWACVYGLPTGVTFHEVEERIDAGEILVQKEYSRDQSMLRFYLQVFADFPTIAVLAIERLLSGEKQDPRPDITSSYYSLPTREEVKKYNVKIAEWKDVFYAIRGN